MKICKIVLAALTTLGSCPPATAQEPPLPNVAAYNVEIIIFRATTTLGAAENWAAEASDRNFSNDSNAGESAPGDATQVGHFIKSLPESQFLLNDIETKLHASAGYAPLAHVAWSQTASAWGTRAGFALARLGVDVPGLTGTVVLERGQFLHLGMTLDYAPASPPAGLAAPAGTVFTLNAGRRVRFNERNYFDHPAFGVIAIVTPVPGTRPAGR